MPAIPSTTSTTPDTSVPSMPRIPMLVRRLDPDSALPAYARPGDAGLDLTSREDVELRPGQRALVPTGVAVAIPAGHAGFVTPRSGSAHRHGLSVVNAPGVVDAGYRGEIFVNLINLDPAVPIAIRRGDRIAQLVVVPVATVVVTPVDVLPPSDRGDTGHGSTGGMPGSG